MVEVSFCIPTFNAEQYIYDTICSIDTKGLESFEIIISDNLSSDGTIKEIKRALDFKNFNNVVIHSNPDQGISQNWNFVLSKARGRFIRLIMQDDLIYENSTAFLISKLKKNKSAVAAFSNRELLFDGTDIASERYSSIRDLFKPLKDESFFDDSVNEAILTKKLFKHSIFMTYPNNKFGEPSFAVLRRSAIQRAGNFNNSLKQSLDYEYWYRLLKFGDILLIDENLGGFRVHNSQMSHHNRFKHTMEPVYVKYLLLTHFLSVMSIQNISRLLFQMFRDFFIILAAKLRLKFSLFLRS